MATLVEGAWLPSHRADPRAITLYRRHYSARKNDRPGRRLDNFMGPGECMVLLTADCAAAFAWQRNTVARFDGQQGVCCVLFRNEGPLRSSDLIREADALAWARWPGQRLFTYIDPKEVASANPGYCFKQAGWQLVRAPDGTPHRSRRGLLLLEHLTTERDIDARGLLTAVRAPAWPPGQGDGSPDLNHRHGAPEAAVSAARGTSR